MVLYYLLYALYIHAKIQRCKGQFVFNENLVFPPRLNLPVDLLAVLGDVFLQGSLPEALVFFWGISCMISSNREMGLRELGERIGVNSSRTSIVVNCIVKNLFIPWELPLAQFGF